MKASFTGRGPFFEQDDVLHVVRVGKHIDRLYLPYRVGGIEEVEVSRLRGGVAAHVDDALWTGGEDGLDHILVHACARRVGDDDVRSAVRVDKVVG